MQNEYHSNKPATSSGPKDLSNGPMQVTMGNFNVYQDKPIHNTVVAKTQNGFARNTMTNFNNAPTGDSNNR